MYQLIKTILNTIGR